MSMTDTQVSMLTDTQEAYLHKSWRTAAGSSTRRAMESMADLVAAGGSGGLRPGLWAAMRILATSQAWSMDSGDSYGDMIAGREIDAAYARKGEK